VSVLHSLSDPTRLEIVRLLTGEPERACSDFHGIGGVSVATLSHHLRVLREAGVTRTRLDGKRRYVSLRRTDLEARFPGLLDPILHAAAKTPIDRASRAAPPGPAPSRAATPTMAVDADQESRS
jgi:DNA-binding transcriptional ArsR family regulator